MSYKEGGWEDKYIIYKRGANKLTCDYRRDCPIGTFDTASCQGCASLHLAPELIPVDENAVYFVLRLDTDIHARNAAFRYAQSVQLENPQLAKDIREKVLGLFEKNMRKGSEKENAAKTK